MNKAAIATGMEDLLKKGKSLLGYEEQRQKEWYEEIESGIVIIIIINIYHHHYHHYHHHHCHQRFVVYAQV